MSGEVMPRVPSAVYEGLENPTVKKKKSKGDRTAVPLSPVASKRFAVDKPPQTSKVDLNDFLKKCEGGQAEEEKSKPLGDIDAPTLSPARSGGGDEEWRKSRSFADSSGSDTGKNPVKTIQPQQEESLNHSVSTTSSSYGGGADGGSLNSSLQKSHLTDESFGLLIAATPCPIPVGLVTNAEIHITTGTKEFHRAKIASVKRRSRNVRRFHRLFQNVPNTEHLLSRFSCAYVGEMGLLIQGHLYISYNWICFHSRIFGKVIEIEANKVATVSKEKTARIIPNAVGIKTEDSKAYLFGSLLSRDNTYQILQCVVNKTAPKELLLPPTVDSLVNGFDHTVVVPAEIIDDPSSSALSSDCSDPSCSSGDGDSPDGTPAVVRHRHSRHQELFQSEPNLDVSTTADKRHEKRKEGQQHSSAKITTVHSGNRERQLRLQTFISWVLGLPKVILFLIASIFVLALLFLCATILTFRLMQLQERHANMASEFPWMLSNVDGQANDRLEHNIDTVISYLAKAKDQLDQLRKELKLTQTAKFPWWPSKEEMS